MATEKVLKEYEESKKAEEAFGAGIDPDIQKMYEMVMEYVPATVAGLGIKGAQSVYKSLMKVAKKNPNLRKQILKQIDDTPELKKLHTKVDDVPTYVLKDPLPSPESIKDAILAKNKDAVKNILDSKIPRYLKNPNYKTPMDLKDPNRIPFERKNLFEFEKVGRTDPFYKPPTIPGYPGKLGPGGKLRRELETALSPERIPKSNFSIGNVVVGSSPATLGYLAFEKYLQEADLARGDGETTISGDLGGTGAMHSTATSYTGEPISVRPYNPRTRRMDYEKMLIDNWIDEQGLPGFPLPDNDDE